MFTIETDEGRLEFLKELDFEVAYFRLCIDHYSALGKKDGKLIFCLEQGAEVGPRENLFSTNAQSWKPPTPVQFSALIKQFKRFSDLMSYSQLSRSFFWNNRKEGAAPIRYAYWRFLLDLAGILTKRIDRPLLRGFYFEYVNCEKGIISTSSR